MIAQDVPGATVTSRRRGILVSERKLLAERLRQAQKMEAIGRLAGGIAHDFNNLLMVISGYSEFLLERLGFDPRLRGPAQEIANATQRATSLTR